MEHFESSALNPVAPASPEDASWDALTAARAISIAELVAKGPASVRLSNTIACASSEGRIPCPTIGDYLDAGSAAPVLFMRALRNFGRRTAYELDALVNKYAEEVSRGGGSCISERESQRANSAEQETRLTALVARIESLTYADAMKGQAPSARLANLLVNHNLGTLSIIGLLTDSAASRASLTQLPNFGRTSFQELEALCRAAAIRALAKDCEDPKSLLDDCALLFNTSIADPQFQALAQQIAEILQAQPPQDRDLDTLLEWAMSSLPERELEVVIRRYGFDGEPAETLEEISAGYGVTRERVRQLEAKAIRRLRGKLEGTLFPALVNETSRFFWANHKTPFLILTSRDSYQVRRALPPKLTLAFDVLNLSIGAWLEQASTAMSNGYLSHSVDAEKVRTLGLLLEDRLKSQPLPIAIGDVLSEHDPGLIEAAVCLETPFTLFESYILRDPPRARLKRAIRLHAILSSSGCAQTLSRLGDLYSAHFPADRCSLRDFVIVMELSPQLFLEIEEGYWAALGRGAEPAIDPRDHFEPDLSNEIDQATVAGSLQEALRTRGPSLVGDLYRAGATILPEGRSRNSIAPVLVGRPEFFLRILPGVYALPEHLLSPADLLHAPLPYWLTEAQGRTYAFARFAGEPWGVFPLWIPAAEYRLCKWARFAGSPALFHSLLAVAEIDAWPVGDVQKNEWRRLATQLARFELEMAGSTPTREVRPELDRLLAACRVSLERGSIGWLQVNRIMGRRLDAAGGQGLLALMIALGAVLPPATGSDDMRLRPHPVATTAAEIAERIEADLIRCGEATWNSTLGQALTEEALSVDPARLGWVSLNQLTNLLRTEPGGDAGADADDEEGEDDLIARLMREHRRSVEQDRRDKAARWLLEA